MIEVGLQVRAAALLTGFDQHDAATVGNVVRLHRFDGEQRRKCGIAVVADAAREEPVIAANRFVGPEAVGPVAERRLLVEVSVKYGRAVARGGGRDRHDEHRRTTFETMNFDFEIGETSRQGPVRKQFYRAIDVSV